MAKATTATKEKTETGPVAEEAQSKGEVVLFSKPRLPYHEAYQEKFGVDQGAWRVLVEAIFPAAKSHEAVLMALAYCKRRNLDPFKRQVHIVPMWSTAKGGYVETVWPGIAELRTTAARTGEYAGCDEATFGPMVKNTFSGKVKDRDSWRDVTVEVTHPEWCRITVYRIIHGQRCRFEGPKVEWLESYATIGKSAVPNDMWESRPVGQLEKCAEAAALRRAFPEEIGNEYTAEEMHGRNLPGDDARDVTGKADEHAPAPPTADPKPDKPAEPESTREPEKPAEKPQQEQQAEPELDMGQQPAGDWEAQAAAALKAMPDPEKKSVDWLAWLKTTLELLPGEELEDFWNRHIAAPYDRLFPMDQEEAMGIFGAFTQKHAP